MIVCCPTTTRVKGYPFEVALAGEPARVVLADQMKSQDWRARKAVWKGRVSVGERIENSVGISMETLVRMRGSFDVAWAL